MKRILCTLLLLFILFSACPISAYAQVIEEELTDGIVYTINSKTGEVIIKGNGEISDYSTSPFLYLNGDIKSVLIESGILKIGARLFRNCTSLEKISISDTVTQIDNTAFDGCKGIKEFSVDIENEVYSSFDGILYSKDLSKLIKYPSAKNDERFATLKNTTTICKNSFKGSVNLKTVVLSSETVNIEENFENLGISLECENELPNPDSTHYHEPIYKTVYPTCSEYGYIEVTCRTCDEKIINKYICPTKHKYTEKITPATTESNGHIVTVCIVCGHIKEDKIINKIESASLDYSSVVYDNHQFSPNVNVVDSNGKSLVQNVDYIYSLPLGRKSVGIYNYDITYFGNYKGTSRLLLFIYPQSPIFNKIILRKTGAELCWNKISAQCDGYEIQYSTVSNFMSDNRYVTVNNKNAKSLKLQNLKSKTRYYFRIRSFKNVTESNVFYSQWSRTGTAKML
ncbi:leucine-rich repeat protein [uncultured Eubacterium sp.]|uniref:leucine-rich repeat protein n=1 Tax=uncultured Eubacterium sp. TaxID=165185 RepID=UPI0025E29D59|nr:leucine-rich repeat protein [uncultured Eubacterium sp.]